MIKPNKLKKGDTIAIVSPSWGGPSIFPHIYENGLKILKEELALKIKEFPSAKAKAEFLYNNPKFRAEDINKAFSDKEVKAIFVSIGGDDSVRILKYLDK
ncbi:MAG: LD-carboxypeptidase, partial [archaeon]